MESTWLSADQPATLIWRNVDAPEVDARRDFARLTDALAFLDKALPLGCKATACIITSSCFVGPEHVPELAGKVGGC